MTFEIRRGEWRPPKKKRVSSAQRRETLLDRIEYLAQHEPRHPHFGTYILNYLAELYFLLNGGKSKWVA